MSKATFRIESVSIEGFKAFATRQTFGFEGRNVFLFGPNGLGKTSIVEAIRWCLFGLASRPGEIVKNQFYAGPCIVQMTLRAADGLWTIQRRLRPAGGESNRIVRDPSGSERNLDDVFPQLSRIGPREGTHVIYAAQQPSSRRPEADITDFRYVVYRYLGVEEIPRLSDELLVLSKDWATQEEEMFKDVEGLGDSFSERINDVDQCLTRITSDPPWGPVLTPTNVDTRKKVDLLARDAANLGARCSTEALDGLTLHEKLYEIETAVDGFLSGNLEGVSQEFEKGSSRLEEAQSSFDNAETTACQITMLSQTVETLKQDLEAALNGAQIGEFENNLQRLEEDLETTQLKLDVVQSALKYLETVGGESDHERCPACDAGFQSGQLNTLLQNLEASGDHRTNDILKQRDQLRKQISTTNDLGDQVEEVETQLTSHRNHLTETLQRAKNTFGLPSPPTIESLRDCISEIHEGCQQLQSAMESRNEASRNWKARIDNVRQEVRFHEQRSRKERLQRLYDVRYEALHESLKALGNLRDVADKTRGLLNAQLRERLQEDLPPLAQEMTEVYLRLTGNPTFDSIRIQQGGERRWLHDP